MGAFPPLYIYVLGVFESTCERRDLIGPIIRVGKDLGWFDKLRLNLIVKQAFIMWSFFIAGFLM